jgi:hypothetical protein
VTLGSSDRAGLPRAGSLGGWLRGIVARWTHRNRLRGISRAEFEQVARELDLSHPALYRLLTGCTVSAALLEQQLEALEISSDRVRAAQATDTNQVSAAEQALLPLCPSCC